MTQEKPEIEILIDHVDKTFGDILQDVDDEDDEGRIGEIRDEIMGLLDEVSVLIIEKEDAE